MNRFLKIFALGLALGFATASGAATAEEEMMMKKSHEGAAATPSGPVKVDKAKGADAYTVEEIHAKGAALDKKKVTVRGKVVKVSAGIMNRNWIHLRDGSGDEAKKTHNLVVTSKDQPSVGDVVTAKGVLAKDRDFGAGYVYAVIVEDASVKK
ncbi:MAG: hypothetical protein ACM31I_01165 [Deltaproteobacteria bacterium]